jgi:hypothetical protein
MNLTNETFNAKPANQTSITLNIPDHILEAAQKKASAEGISLDALIIRSVEVFTFDRDFATAEPVQKIGLMPDAVMYIADDFDAIPEGFEDYV